MKLLALETSCDETAAAVIENGRIIRSNIVLSQIEEHRLYGGVVPEIASRRHVEGISYVVEEALRQAAVNYDDLDGVAVTAAPGLIGALLVGVNFAKGVALAKNLPLIPVHHIRGHVAANYLAHPTLEPPFLALIVSGGHSHIVSVEDYTTFRVLGRTRDDAAGEAFDKAARSMGLPYPGGVEIDKASRTGNPLAYEFPFPQLDTPYDFSFSGLKTAVVNLLHNAEQKGESVNINDLAASFQNRVTEILAETFFAAAEENSCKTLVCAGGVAANQQLRQRLEEGASARGAKLYIPPLSLCGDNAAMIGAQGYQELLKGNISDMTLNAFATYPIEKPLR